MLVRFLRLLLLVFVCLPAIAVAAGPAADARNLKPVAATGGEKRVALVIGNNSYQTVSKLEKAANDARAVGRALEQAGFRTRSVIDGNRTQMNMAINQFVEEVAGGGIGVFFFAGHGVQVNNQNFLIPVDLPQIAREADIADHGISLQILQDKIADARAKFSLLVVDACRDNPLPKKAGRSVGAMRGLTQASSAEGQMVVFSAGANQQALDKLSPNDANPNGVFTREFLPWVTQPGVTIRDAVLSVRSAVRAKAKTVDHDQFPAIYDQAEGNFYFIFQGPTTVNVQPGAADPETALWSEVKLNGTREYYEAYLRQYPKGKYAVLAQVELGKLAEKEKTEKAKEEAERKFAAERDAAEKSGREVEERQRAANLVRPTTGQAVAALATVAASAEIVSPRLPDLGAPDGRYPSGPVRIVVPFPAGGTSDAVARHFAQRLSALSGQAFIVENRAGAGGLVGGEAVAKAVADGYTLLLGSTSTLSISPGLGARPPYDVQRDFVPVALLAETPLVLVAGPAMGVSSASELVRFAKARPGHFNYASGGVGSLSHLAGELFRERNAINVLHVPYRGAAPALTDLLGGHAYFMFAEPGQILTHLQAGRLRALAVTADRRLAMLPDTPTLAEAGTGSMSAGNWLGLLAPAGTSASIVARLNQLLHEALKNAELRERLGAMGMRTASALGPDRLSEAIRNDGLQWATVIRSGGIRLE